MSILSPVSRSFSFSFLLLDRSRSGRFSDVADKSEEATGAVWGTFLLAGSVGVAIDFGISLEELEVFDDEFLRACRWPDNRCCPGGRDGNVVPKEEHVRQVQVFWRTS